MRLAIKMRVEKSNNTYGVWIVSWAATDATKDAKATTDVKVFMTETEAKKMTLRRGYYNL